MIRERDVFLKNNTLNNKFSIKGNERGRDKKSRMRELEKTLQRRWVLEDEQEFTRQSGCSPAQKRRLERELAACVWNNKQPVQVEHKMVKIKMRVGAIWNPVLKNLMFMCATNVY